MHTLLEITAMLGLLLWFAGYAYFNYIAPATDNEWPGNESYGYTYCLDDEPVTWINVNQLGTEDLAATVAHEQKHAHQIRRWVTCEKYEAWFAANEAEAEAEAFCEDVRASPLPVDSAIAKYAEWMIDGYDLGISKDSAVWLLRKFCPRGFK